MPLILRPLVQHLRRLAAPVAAAAESDAALLDRFVCRHDEDAFAALVARHGAMVLRLCRQVLGNDHAAEDAFQACFLVLARRAGSIRHKDTLAAWLHAVALRLALRVRATARRQPAGFSGEPIEPADTRGDALDTLSARDLLVALDEEIAQLPERYRLPVLLCCIEGRSQEEAARQLAWTPGSVKGRLERGRKRLHDRLVRRGLTLGAALAMAEIARGSGIGLPASLTATTVKFALAFGSAQAARGSVEAARLAGEFLAGSGAAKIRACMALLLMLGLAALGASAIQSPLGELPPAQPKPAGEPMAPKVEAKGHVDHEGFALPPEAIARIGSARFRSGGYIQAVGYLADGKTILVIDRDGRVQLCDTKSGAFRQPVEFKGATQTCTWNPDGKTVFLYGAGVCHGLDLASGRILFQSKIPNGSGSHAQQFSADGSLIALATRNEVRVVNVGTGKEKYRIQIEPKNPVGVAFSPDGTTLAVGTNAQEVAVFDAATGNPRFMMQPDLKEISHLQFSPDGKKLLCAFALFADTGILMDLATRKEVARLQLTTTPKNYIWKSAFSPDGRFVAMGGLNGARLFDALTGKELRHYPSIGAQGLSFSADGKTLVMGGGSGELSQWDVHSGKLLPESSDYRDNFEVVRFLGDGTRLLVVAKEYIVYDWKAVQPIRHFAGPEAYFRSDWRPLAPDSSLIAWPSDNDNGISLRDAKTGKEVRRLAEDAASRSYLHFSPDSRKLFFVGDKPNVISIADVATGRMLPELRGNDLPIWSIRVSPNGRSLAAFIGAEKTRKIAGVILWDVETGRLVHRVAIDSSYAAPTVFTASSGTLAVATTLGTASAVRLVSEVKLVNVATGSISRSFVVPGQIAKLAFSHDERTMAISEGEGSLSLWEVATGQLRHRFVGHRMIVHALAYSLDGAMLAASSYDAPALVWDIYGKHSSNVAAAEKGFAADHARIWEGLGSKDAVQGFQMVRRLVRNPDPAVALLRTKLHPAKELDTKRIAQWLRDLDSEDFDAREAASAELEKLGDRIEGPLQKARAIATLETQRRLDTLLAKAETGPDRLRQTRALEALEQIATPPAVPLLETLAGGDRGARLTNEATAALARIRNR